MSLDCSAVESLFSPRLDDELDLAARAAFDLHVRDCARCAAGFFRLRASLAALRGLPAPDVRGLAQRVLDAALDGEGAATTALAEPLVAPTAAEPVPTASAVEPSARVAPVPLHPAPSPLPAAPSGSRSGRAWRRLRAPLVGVAAAAALVGASAAAGAWGGRSAAMPDRVLAAHGLVRADDGWISVAERAHRARGEVWIDGAWRERDAARRSLVGELEPRHGAWLDAAARDALDRGLVLGNDGWTAREAVAESTLRAAGLSREGESWVADADRAGLRLDGRAVDPEEWFASRLASAGYVRGDDGRWRPAEDLRREQAGEVRIAGEWLRPEAALARWLSDRGYVQVDGRWRDPALAAADPAAPAAPAIAAPPPPDPWIELTRLPGVREAAPTADAARAALRQARNVETRAAPQKPHPVPFTPGPGLTGWRVPLASESSHPALGTPAIIDGRVHVGEGLGGYAVDCFAADTGKPLWSTRLADNGPSNPVASSDGVVYATDSCSVYALNGRTGHAAFARWLGVAQKAMPAVAADQILCTTAVPGGGFALVGQGLRSPRTWASPLGADVRTAPVVIDDRVIAATRSGAVVCWRAADGGEIWRTDAGALSAPVAGGGKLVLRRALRARDATRYAETLATLDLADGSWTQPRVGDVHPILAHRPPSDEAAAATEPPLPDLGPVACADGVAVAVRESSLEAVDVASGRTLWSVALDGAAEPGATASDPCIARDEVIVGTLAGELIAFDAADGSRRWTARIGAPIGNGSGAEGAMLRVQPVVANGHVYVTTRTGELVCVDTGDATLDGPHAWGAR